MVGYVYPVAPHLVRPMADGLMTDSARRRGTIHTSILGCSVLVARIYLHGANYSGLDQDVMPVSLDVH